MDAPPAGAKRWRIATAGSGPLLYPFPSHAGYEAELLRPDFDRFPAARLAEVWDVVARPGDTIFVPAGALHQVENLDSTVAITMNYIDRACLPIALPALRARGLSEPAIRELASMATRLDAEGVLPDHPPHRDMKWSDFKAQELDAAPRRLMAWGNTVLDIFIIAIVVVFVAILIGAWWAYGGAS